MTGQSDLEKLWLSPPHMCGKELEYVRDAFESNWIAPLGPHVEAFEQELAAYVGVRHVAALSSGTAAIHLALILLGITKGDFVLCSSLTFAASANPIVYLGARPVFLDSELDSWNISPECLETALQNLSKSGIRPKALVLVQLYGVPAQIQQITEICERYGVAIIEDAAEALGSEYDGRKLGNFGSCGIFSFNGNKIITTSGGGALVSNDANLISKARFLATQARDVAPHYEHSQIGYNYRMSNILAAVGRGQLTTLDTWMERRRANFEHYRARLEKAKGYEFVKEPAKCRSNRWLTTFLTENSNEGRKERDALIAALAKKNIEARPVWKPLHLQTVFSEAKYFGGSNAQSIFERGLCLPSGSGLNESDLNRVCMTIEELF